jgi:fluoride exporter
VTALQVLAVALGAALGAPMRYVVERRLASSRPLGTLTVNVVGSAVLGALVAWAASTPASSAEVVALVGTGFCGSLTTFGGYAAQVLDLAVAPRGGERGASTAAWAYATVSVVACVGIAALAYLVVSAVIG